MTAKTPAQRQEAKRQRRTALGLVRLELWALPEHHAQIRAYVAKLLAIKKNPAERGT